MIRSGVVVGSYRVIEPVGKGGTGVVYLAEHVALGRRVALKVLRGDAADDEDAASRFFTEARLVNRVGHEHIVDITDFGTTPQGQCYFAMELLVGETLGARLRREGPFALKRTLHVAVQIAGAISASHEVGIIHRDLKPENVFLIDRMGDVDFVKVLDFGLAKHLGIDAHGMPTTLQGTIQGTPHYMSPEQALGRNDVDHRTDIYALGVVLFQMVTGELPFTADGWGEVMLMHATHPFPSVRLHRPVLPERFEALVMRAVDKDREQRFASMGELRDSLLGLLDSSYLPGAEASRPPFRVSAEELGNPDSGRLDSGRLMEDRPTDVKGMGMLAAGPEMPTLMLTDRGATRAFDEASGMPTLRSPPPSDPVAAPRRWPWLVGAATLGLGLVVGAVRFSVASDPPSPPAAASSSPRVASAAADGGTAAPAGADGAIAVPTAPPADAGAAAAPAAPAEVQPEAGSGAEPPTGAPEPTASPPRVPANRAARGPRNELARPRPLRRPRAERSKARAVPRAPANKYDVLEPD